MVAPYGDTGRRMVSSVVGKRSASPYTDDEDAKTNFSTTEDTILRPVSPYGATKALGEHLLHVYWHSFGVPAVTLRYFTVYGPRQRPDMAFHRLGRALLTGGTFELYGDGNQRRDFTYVLDTVEGTIAAAQRGRIGATYNLGGGSAVSMIDVIHELEEISGRSIDIQWQPVQRGDVRDTGADTTRARHDLGYWPGRSLADGLKAELGWLEAELTTIH